MKKSILILLFVVLLTSFSVAYAQNEAITDVFNIHAADVSSIAIKYNAYMMPKKTYVLDDAELVNSLMLQFKNLAVARNNDNTYEDMLPEDISAERSVKYEISFNTSDGIRSFWISEDYYISEYSQMSDETKFNYYFINEKETDKWLEKTLEVSRIWHSQKQNMLLSNDEDIKVYLQVDDIKMRLFFDSKPKIINGSTMIPVRNIAEALDITVEWKEQEQEVVLQKHISIILQIGKDTTKWSPYGNIQLDAAPFIENNIVYVPLRFISEIYNTNIIYDSAANSAYLSELIQDGWCIDYKGNYKIKVFKEHYFVNRTIMGNYVEAYFTLPYGKRDSLYRPVTSIIDAGRLNMNIDDEVNSITSEHSHRETFKVEYISSSECIISFEYNKSEETEWKDEQMYVLMYLKKDGDTVLYADIDCSLDYFLEYKDDIIDYLKSITNIN